MLVPISSDTDSISPSLLHAFCGNAPFSSVQKCFNFPQTNLIQPDPSLVTVSQSTTLTPAVFRLNLIRFLKRFLRGYEQVDYLLPVHDKNSLLAICHPSNVRLPVQRIGLRKSFSMWSIFASSLHNGALFVGILVCSELLQRSQTSPAGSISSNSFVVFNINANNL